MRSALSQTSSGLLTISAPCLRYCSSLMPLPWPAPDWMSTLLPPRVSSSTPTGVRATRDSCVLISLGTPTTHLLERETGNGMAVLEGRSVPRGSKRPRLPAATPARNRAGGGYGDTPARSLLWRARPGKQEGADGRPRSQNNERNLFLFTVADARMMA